MKYERARKIFDNLPDQIQRELNAKMIAYFQETPLLITLKPAKRRNREQRYFVSLVDNYLKKSSQAFVKNPPPQ